MSAKDAAVPAKRPDTQNGALEIAWTSKVYERLRLTRKDLERLAERYLGAGILTEEDLNRELHKAACWLRDNPVRAGQKRSWYKFLNNWFARAEEQQRARIQTPRRRTDRRSAPDERDLEETRSALREGRPPF